MKLSEMTNFTPTILLYGPPGTQKTALSLTAGGCARMLDIDGGVVTGKTLKDEFKARRGEVDIVQFIDATPSLNTLYIKFRSTIRELPSMIKTGRFPFKVLIIDSLTAWATASMNSVLKISNRVNENPRIQDWGACFQDIENSLIILKSLSIAVIVIAHSMEIEDANDRLMIRIAVPGKKFPPKIPRLFQEIWLIQARKKGKDVELILRTKPGFNYDAKTRYGVPDETLVATGMPKLLEMCDYHID